VSGTTASATSPTTDATHVAVPAAYGLPGAPSAPAEPLDDPAWTALTDAATRERVTPLLASAVAAGAFPATDRQYGAIVRAHERSMRTCVALERTLGDAATTLEHAGVAYRVVKGPAVAHLDYPNPSLRAFGDIDLLVAAERYDDALTLLTDRGGRRRYPEVRPGFDRRFGKGACLVLADGTEIDVHRTFVAGPFGLTVDLDALFATDEQFTLGGRSLPALCREHRFVHACFHAALGDAAPRLSAQRDVAQLALDDRTDVAGALEAARAWRSDAVVARAVTTTWSRLGLQPTPLVRWALAHQPDRFQARALRAYSGPGRSYATQTAAGLAAVDGLAGKAAYLRAVLVADRDHVRRHDGGYVRRLRRGWQALRATRTTR